MQLKLDQDNEKWFAKDYSVATLRRIQLADGSLRSLNDLDIELSYPISAIAGENGTGKSTVLAMAVCAFHNGKTGFRPMGKKNTYYTFSDFFIQSKEDTPPEGIQIKYQILHNRGPRGEEGPRWQTRTKRKGGKWTNYDSRVHRNVAFLGITRVVPPPKDQRMFLTGDISNREPLTLTPVIRYEPLQVRYWVVHIAPLSCMNTLNTLFLL